MLWENITNNLPYNLKIWNVFKCNKIHVLDFLLLTMKDTSNREAVHKSIYTVRLIMTNEDFVTVRGDHYPSPCVKCRHVARTCRAD